VARNIFVELVVPLAIGLAIGRWLFPKTSPARPRTVLLVANVLLVVAFVPLLIGVAPEMGKLIGDGTMAAMAIVVVIALAGGHFLGGPADEDRTTLAVAASLRHPGIALALAGANHAAKPVTAAVLLFMLVGMVVLIVYQLAMKTHRPVPASQD
jgi:BASS family bile acid:Na+ symporter